MRRRNATIAACRANGVVFPFQIIGGTLANCQNGLSAFSGSIAEEQIVVTIVEAVEI